MEAPREVRIAIALSWSVLAIETADRFFRISTDHDVNYYSRLPLILATATLSSVALVALFTFAASRRKNWGRIALLLSTTGGWLQWLLYASTIGEYAWWQWLAYGSITAMEFAALLLLFHGNGAIWYQRPGLE